MNSELGRYLVARIARGLATVLGVVTLVFLLVRMIPGDPIDTILGDRATPEDRADLRERLHLDDSLPVQYLRFLGDVADGSLGRSFRSDRPVGERIAEVLPDTAALALAALALALALAIPLGVLAAARRGTGVDRLASTFAVLGLAIPNIWLGPLLVLAFAVQLRWLPLPGDDAVGALGLVLPAITLGTAFSAVLARQVRAATAEALGQPHVTAARARGLGEGALLRRHALRVAWLPTLTVAAAQLGALLSGTVVVEKIFERPGLGALFLDAFFDRDLPMVQGCVLVIALTYVTVNLALDLSYAFVDPRLRVGSER